MEKIQMIDHVPTANWELVSRDIAGWLLANAFMALDARAVHAIEQFQGSYLNFTLGWYVSHPNMPGKHAPVETSFTVEMGGMRQFDNEYEDPAGDRWHCYRPSVQVSWPSYGGDHSWELTQKRADLIAATVELGNRLLAQFGEIVVWTQGSSKADRERIAFNGRKNRTQEALTASLAVAIHTTCRFMKVGTERWIKAPPVAGGIVPGEYTICVEAKTYVVNVHQDGRDMDFMRTK